ncbi:alpha/beta fold hydrolase [Bosea sp. (in: a-proteobacteria)]|uniref:alpha/beta fold hydrolase n=1 Tax=Bosea sp. (in: a-proteobacteria) TaxID=1871050 RepID=UPI00261FF2B8|nr:alpha/beta fold hydrolase [Bosea sp. (in: a-proteobacteria)]MCO5090099.1 alpha/beta fold hydrolase [Bosea sp. (in: a-proteobacteria)]
MVNGFNCRIEGAPDAPWVVLSNAIGTNLSLWDDLVPALSPRYRILRYDQRGHGKSIVPPAPYSFAELASDVTMLMDSAGIARAHFVGMSMGGVTGWELALTCPERLHSLTICDAAVSGSAAAWEERLAVIRTAGFDALVEPTLARWFSKRALATQSPALQRVRAMLQTTPPPGFEGCANALQAFDYTHALEAIETPVLLVSGAEDGLRPQAMLAEAKRIPGARSCLVPDAGHLSNIENPEVFNRAVVDFIDGVEAARK